jgi:site-specific recombinase XerD
LGAPKIEVFLTHLDFELKVAASAQNQALCALLLLYRYVLRQEIELSINAVRAKKSRYLPTVLSHEEAIAVITQLSGTYQLIFQILY